MLATLPLLGKVPIGDSLRGGGNLLVRWKITLMTMTAFTLRSRRSSTVMLAFVNGMYDLTAHSSQPGQPMMVLSDGAAPDEAFSNLVDREHGQHREPGRVLKDEKPARSWQAGKCL